MNLCFEFLSFTDQNTQNSIPLVDVLKEIFKFDDCKLFCGFCVFRSLPMETWTMSGLEMNGCPAWVCPSTALISWSHWWMLACLTTWPRKNWGASWRWWTVSTGPSSVSTHCSPMLLWYIYKCVFFLQTEWVYTMVSCVWSAWTMTGKSWRGRGMKVNTRTKVSHINTPSHALFA